MAQILKKPFPWHLLALQLRVLPPASHEQTRYYWNADVIPDQFACGCAGMVSLEAIACGRPAVTYVTSGYEDFPLKDVVTEDHIVEATMQADSDLWKRQYEYLKKKHEPASVVERLLAIYDSLISK